MPRTASLPNLDTTESLILPFWMKKTASDGSPCEKIDCFLRNVGIFAPLPIVARIVRGSRSRLLLADLVGASMDFSRHKAILPDFMPEAIAKDVQLCSQLTNIW
jgi:hypothetical protein